MAAHPKVTVLMTTYNRKDMIKTAIHSILAQTYADFEFLIVDDGSTDHTEEVVKSYSDQRMRYIRLGKNRGVAAARNVGLRYAQGELIAFQDSDDISLPDRLKKQVYVLEKAPDHVGVVISAHLTIYRENGRYQVIYSYPEISERNLSPTEILGAIKKPTVVPSMIKKRYIKQVGGFYASLPAHDDWEILFRLAKNCEFRFIAEPLYIFRHHEGSMTRNIEALIKAKEMILKKHYEDYLLNKRILADTQAHIGVTHCIHGDFKRGQYFLFEAARVFPSPKNIMKVLLSLCGKRAFCEVFKLKRKLIP